MEKYIYLNRIFVKYANGHMKEMNYYDGVSGKDLLANGDVRHMGLILGSGRYPGGGQGNPLQYSCLENPLERGAWWSMVHKVAKSLTQLKQLSMYY